MRLFPILAVLCIAACTPKPSDAPSEEPAAATEAETAPTGDAPPADAEATDATPTEVAPTVTVADAGKEPQQVLRYQTSVGDTVQTQILIGSKVDAVVAVLRVGSPRTVLAYDTSFTTKSVDSNGDATIAFEVTNASKVDELPPGAKRPPQTDKDKASAKRLSEGSRMSGTFTRSAQGILNDFTMQAAGGGAPPLGVADAVRWAITEITPMLPSEAVGADAKWTTTQGLIQGGIAISQTTTVDLTKVTEAGVVFRVTSEQTAEAQRYTNATTGAEFDLQVMRGSTTGTLAWNLAELAPTAAAIDAEEEAGSEKPRPPGETRRASVVSTTARTIAIGDVK